MKTFLKTSINGEFSFIKSSKITGLSRTLFFCIVYTGDHRTFIGAFNECV